MSFLTHFRMECGAPLFSSRQTSVLSQQFRTERAGGGSINAPGAGAAQADGYTQGVLPGLLRRWVTGDISRGLSG